MQTSCVGAPKCLTPFPPAWPHLIAWPCVENWELSLPVNDTVMEVLQARAALRTNRTQAVFVNEAGHPRGRAIC